MKKLVFILLLLIPIAYSYYTIGIAPSEKELNFINRTNITVNFILWNRGNEDLCIIVNSSGVKSNITEPILIRVPGGTIPFVNHINFPVTFYPMKNGTYYLSFIASSCKNVSGIPFRYQVDVKLNVISNVGNEEIVPSEDFFDEKYFFIAFLLGVGIIILCLILAKI